jgi:hypothetical protein
MRSAKSVMTMNLVRPTRAHSVMSILVPSDWTGATISSPMKTGKPSSVAATMRPIKGADMEPKRGSPRRRHGGCGQLRQLAGVAAQAAAYKRGVARLQPHISRQSAKCPLKPAQSERPHAGEGLLKTNLVKRLRVISSEAKITARSCIHCMHSLFDNAIQSIQLGVEDFGANDPKRTLSAVRNFYAGTLLLAKEVLVRAAPKASPDTILAARLKVVPDGKGDVLTKSVGHRTIDFVDIGERFKDFGLQIDHSALQDLNRIRAEVEHLYTTARREKGRRL